MSSSSLSSSSAPSYIYVDEPEVEDEVATWMQPMDRPWDDISEDAQGGLRSTQLQKEKERKKALALTTSAGAGVVIEKGVIRYLYIIIDTSWASNITDQKPSRRLLILSYLDAFIHSFFDQNPLSHLGLLLCCHSRCHVVTELSGNPSEQRKLLAKSLNDASLSGGDFSLQNGLDLAKLKLSQIPPYGAREVLVLMSALSTIDPGDIMSTMEECVQSHISVSIISLAAEMHVASVIAKSTGGRAQVALEREHLKRLIDEHVPPQPAKQSANSKKQSRKWINMGFPEQKYQPYPVMCACHESLRYGGFTCPKCHSRFCELPTECKVCALTLVSAPHLARSYHHLMPVDGFEVVDEAEERRRAKEEKDERKARDGIVDKKKSKRKIAEEEEEDEQHSCFSCCHPIVPSVALRLRCPHCRSSFCIDCDEYIHLVLHNCPGCAATNVASTRIKKSNTEAEQEEASKETGAKEESKQTSALSSSSSAMTSTSGS